MKDGLIGEDSCFTQVKGDAWAWAVTKGQVLVLSSGAVKGACVYVGGSDHLWGLCRGLWPGYYLGSR